MAISFALKTSATENHRKKHHETPLINETFGESEGTDRILRQRLALLWASLFTPRKDVMHLVMLPTYRTPIEVLQDTPRSPVGALWVCSLEGNSMNFMMYEGLTTAIVCGNQTKMRSKSIEHTEFVKTNNFGQVFGHHKWFAPRLFAANTKRRFSPKAALCGGAASQVFGAKIGASNKMRPQKPSYGSNAFDILWPSVNFCGSFFF